MKITIKRSFEDTRQKRQFEPIKASCTASAEYEIAGTVEPECAREMQELSRNLDAFVRAEVSKTIASALDEGKECRNCGGIQRYGGTGLDDDGHCAACAADIAAKKREFAKAKKDAESGNLGLK